MMGYTRLVCHVDGGARGNPGPAAIGVVFYDETAPARGQPDGEAPTPLVSWGARIGHATNNVAEYQAVVAALDRAIEMGANELVVRSDSELLVRQMNGQYRVKEAHLKVLYQRVGNLAARLGGVKFEHVPRSANREADRLVNAALDLVPPETI
jgi:ribonuclease HI